MKLDMRELPLAARYKIMTSTVTPRPIAWVTSLSADGVVNAAPYSFFNCVGADPPLVVLGLLHDFATGEMKDTATNIQASREFTVNLVREADAAQMNETSASVPRAVSEVDYAGLATLPSEVVAPPRIATSPASFECRAVEILVIGKQTVVIGEVLIAHVADEFITDPAKLYLDTPAMGLVARTHGAGWYARTTDQFSMERPVYDPERLHGSAVLPK
jgi:flavin reductase (DIM6/NTAB) family NADH-FMN oxidoreductase RutF